MNDTEKTALLIDNLKKKIVCPVCEAVHDLEDLVNGTHCAVCNEDLTKELF